MSFDWDLVVCMGLVIVFFLVVDFGCGSCVCGKVLFGLVDGFVVEILNIGIV